MAFTTAPGVREDPLSGFRFLVELSVVGASLSMGFKTVSGLEREVESVEYREGDDGIGVRKLPGLVVHPNITLERGISSNSFIVEWFAGVSKYRLSDTKTGPVSNFGAFAGPSTSKPNYAATVTIKLLGRDGKPQRTWTLTEAWPTKLTWEDLDAESSDILISTLELAYAYMEVS